jgi:hypothetical protein
MDTLDTPNPTFGKEETSDHLVLFFLELENGVSRVSTAKKARKL